MQIELLDRFERELEAEAKANHLEFKRCSLYHFHLRGAFLLNIYPTTRAVYVQGSNNKTTFKDIAHLIRLCNGEVDLKGVQKGKRKGNISSNRRNYLWGKGVRFCFVCGDPINTIKEATLEHKVPLSKGGSNRVDNLTLSHEACNQKRGCKLAIGDKVLQ